MSDEYRCPRIASPFRACVITRAHTHGPVEVEVEQAVVRDELELGLELFGCMLFCSKES